MAKVKKSANKRSTAIKASSGKGWKKKFNLQSRKVQFFVVIAIVALLGGGWFTYKSFAVPKTIKVCTATTNCLSARYGAKRIKNPAKATTYIIQIKNGQSAISAFKEAPRSGYEYCYYKKTISGSTSGLKFSILYPRINGSIKITAYPKLNGSGGYCINSDNNSAITRDSVPSINLDSNGVVNILKIDQNLRYGKTPY